jgi:hypothetical protein
MGGLPMLPMFTMGGFNTSSISCFLQGLESISTRVTRLGKISPFWLLFKGPVKFLGEKYVFL